MMKFLPKYITLVRVLLLSMITTSCRNSGDISINVHVWEDNNGNQIQDLGEIDFPGINIQILSSSNYSLWSLSTTNVDGMVSEFAAGASCGEFIVVVSVPSGYWPTTPVLSEIDNCKTAYFGLRPYP